MNYRFPYFLNKLPLVEIEIISLTGRIRLSALIDTGADYTLFSRNVAERLGVEVEKGEMKVLEGAGGKIVAFIHPLTLFLCGKKIETRACFSEGDDVPEHLLGRKDVITHFKLIFDKDYFWLVDYE